MLSVDHHLIRIAAGDFGIISNTRVTAYMTLVKSGKAPESVLDDLAVGSDRANRQKVAEELKVLGNEAYKREEWEEAARLYALSVKTNPDYSIAYFNWGQTLIKSQQYQLALKMFEKAVAINPQYWKAHRVQMETLFLVGDYPEARKYAERLCADPAFEKVPQDEKKRILQQAEKNLRMIRQYNNPGLMASSLGNWKKAVQLFTEGIDLNDQDPRLFYNRGIAYISMGDHHLGFKDFKKAVEINPKHEKARNNFFASAAEEVKNLSMQKKDREVLDLIDQILVHSPSDDGFLRIFFDLALSEAAHFIEQDDHRQAIDFLDRILTKSPIDNATLHTCYFHRALCLIKLERYKEGLLELAKVLSDPAMHDKAYVMALNTILIRVHKKTAYLSQGNRMKKFLYIYI